MSTSAAILVALRIKVRVIPGIFMWRQPVVIEGILINNHFHAGSRAWSTKVVVGTHFYFHLFAQAKGSFVPIHFRRFYSDFKFGQFVFLQSEQCSAADVMLAVLVIKSY